MAQKLIVYKPPEWSRVLKDIPKAFIQLAQRPTPIEKWALPGVPSRFKILVKRDDLTGNELSGNKVRKLEFLLADALRLHCRHLITCGAVQSNHCRAVAVAGAQLGVKTHLFLRSHLTDVSELEYEGNSLINKLCAADIYLIPKKAQYLTNIKPRMEALAKSILEKTGENSYLIPVGGSDSFGLWGYIEGFREIQEQNPDITDLVCVCGTGGTAAGLAIANYLAGSPYRCHGICVCDGRLYFHGHVNEMLAALEMAVRSEDIITIHEEYRGLGYGLSQPCELEFIAETARHTGILLDPVYVGKAAYGLSQLVKSAPEVFAGEKILFLHSGGTLGMMTDQISSALLPFTQKTVS